ncbi:hypothetical protein NA57DRAFT_58489 [Rhizodiscina lignyota]|uniref:Uncharacterized protein n=1 Tax=Rhizodiscina lignyota TaxID=1504668 RepID=A0A9P4IC67_9PEZI|nr:hypothetical protein NA57DRAFT_58489 [Rhizodiscina lignyota]
MFFLNLEEIQNRYRDGSGLPSRDGEFDHQSKACAPLPEAQHGVSDSELPSSLHKSYPTRNRLLTLTTYDSQNHTRRTLGRQWWWSGPAVPFNRKPECACLPANLYGPSSVEAKLDPPKSSGRPNGSSLVVALSRSTKSDGLPPRVYRVVRFDPRCAVDARQDVESCEAVVGKRISKAAVAALFRFGARADWQRRSLLSCTSAMRRAVVARLVAVEGSTQCRPFPAWAAHCRGCREAAELNAFEAFLHSSTVSCKDKGLKGTLGENAEKASPMLA